MDRGIQDVSVEARGTPSRRLTATAQSSELFDARALNFHSRSSSVPPKRLEGANCGPSACCNPFDLQRRLGAHCSHPSLREGSARALSAVSSTPHVITVVARPTPGNDFARRHARPLQAPVVEAEILEEFDSTSKRRSAQSATTSLQTRGGRPASRGHSGHAASYGPDARPRLAHSDTAGLLLNTVA